MANQRILSAAPATLTFTNLDADGIPVDAVGAMTVGVVRGDGSTVLAAGAATTHGATGVYTVALTATHTATLDLLTATWTDAGPPPAAHTTKHEVVGGYLFSVADVRGFEGLNDPEVYPNAAIIAARAEVENELEQIRSAAFVPRYARLILNGSGDGDILTGLSWLRTLRTARIYTQGGGTSSTLLTAGQLAACILTEDGRIRRADGDSWIWGLGNIVLEVEHGFTDWGQDLKIAALTRLRERLNHPDTGIPDRATRFVNADGTDITLGSANVDSTGNPNVDAVYARYPRPSQGDAPASGILSYAPQWTGIFRGARR